MSCTTSFILYYKLAVTTMVGISGTMSSDTLLPLPRWPATRAWYDPLEHRRFFYRGMNMSSPLGWLAGQNEGEVSHFSRTLCLLDDWNLGFFGEDWRFDSCLSCCFVSWNWSRGKCFKQVDVPLLLNDAGIMTWFLVEKVSAILFNKTGAPVFCMNPPNKGN